MKHIRLFFLATIAFLLAIGCPRSYAQLPYKASVGGMVHFFASGFSFKTCFTHNLAFQADVFFKVLFTGEKETYTYSTLAVYGSFAINPHFIYQKKIKNSDALDLFLLIGGGTSLGITPIQGNGKFGANAIFGLEFVFNFPLAIQIDMRPGYGLLFNPSGQLMPYGGGIFDISPYPHYSPWHHFDWSFGVTIRKTFRKNQIN